MVTEQVAGIVVALVGLATALISGLKVVLNWAARQLENRDVYQRTQLDAAVTERKSLTDRFLQSLDERAIHDREADEKVASRLEDVARLMIEATARSSAEHKALMDILSMRRSSDVQ